MATLAQIYRHPIKAHGSERLAKVALAADATMPWDRVWAVAHERSRADGSEWARCGNFSRGASSPSLMAITCTLNEAEGTLRLEHPDLEALEVNPDEDGDAIVRWSEGLIPTTARASSRVVRAGSAATGQGLTDNLEPYVSLLSLSSLSALSQKAGRDLSPLRFRGNLWVDGAAPWEEFDWVGRRIRMGQVELQVEDRIDRCPATTVNPATGRPDTATLDLLQEGWGHIDFGVFARVVTAGTVNEGDLVEVIA